MESDNFTSIRSQVLDLEMIVTGRKVSAMKFRNEFKRIRNEQAEISTQDVVHEAVCG